MSRWSSAGKTLRRRADGYAHANRFQALKRMPLRQRAILGGCCADVRRTTVRQSSRLSVTPSTITAGIAAGSKQRVGRFRRPTSQRPQQPTTIFAMAATLTVARAWALKLGGTMILFDTSKTLASPALILPRTGISKFLDSFLISKLNKGDPCELRNWRF